MKRLLLPALCALIAGHAGAAPVSPDEAKHAVAAWLATTSVPDGDKIASIRPANVISYEDDDGTALFYVVVLEEGGFVVTAADDTISPILSYSTTGDPPDEDPRNPFWALTAMSVQSQMDAAETDWEWKDDPKADMLGESVMPAPRDEWAALLDVDLGKLDQEENPVKTVSDTRVDRILADRGVANHIYWLTQDTATAANANWNYTTTYKYANISQRFGAEFAGLNYANWAWGCGVVAVAKVIMYWGHPQSRPSGFSYQPPSPLAEYNWKSLAWGTDRISDVALLSDVGEAMGATYKLADGCAATGKVADDDKEGSTSKSAAQSSLIGKFGYANAEFISSAQGLDESTFRRILCSNLDAECPVLMGLSDHALVADGYGYIGSVLYYHLDLGWGGTSYDYWWKLPALPVSKIGYGLKQDDYNAILSLTYNIFPLDKNCQIISGRVADSNGKGCTTQVSISGPGANVCTTSNGKGIFYFLVPKGSGTYTITAQYLLESKTRSVRLDGEKLNYWGCDFTFDAFSIDPGGFDPGGFDPGGAGSVGTVRVTFNANGGSVSPKSRSVKAGAAVGTLPKPARKGYVFTGWYTAKSGGAKVSAAKKITKNTTLYAQWAKKRYKVKFVPNGGTGKMAVQKFTYGKAKKLTANKFKRKGYVFLGWSKSKNGALAYKNKKAVKNLTKKGGTLKLYAKWGKKVVITFNPNGGTVRKKKKTVMAGQSLGTLPAPTRAGWVFDGWCLSKYGFGNLVGKNSAFYSSVTLYARWSKSAKLPKGSYTRTVNGIVWKFDISNKKATVTGIWGALSKPSSLRVPSKLGGRPVTLIGKNAFLGQSKLTSITLPSSVKSIEYQAFGYSGLASITLPKSVTRIGNNAFAGCSSLASITVPDRVTSIGDSAFWGCSNLKVVRIGDKVKSIGDYAFSSCPKLAVVTIGNSVTSLPPQAFSGCSELTSITIGNGVKTIGQWAFFSCSKLTSLTIPDNVTSIGGYAFYSCYGLGSISIPAHLQSQVPSWRLPASCRVVVR